MDATSRGRRDENSTWPPRTSGARRYGGSLAASTAGCTDLHEQRAPVGRRPGVPCSTGLPRSTVLCGRGDRWSSTGPLRRRRPPTTWPNVGILRHGRRPAESDGTGPPAAGAGGLPPRLPQASDREAARASPPPSSTANRPRTCSRVGEGAQAGAGTERRLPASQRPAGRTPPRASPRLRPPHHRAAPAPSWHERASRARRQRGDRRSPEGGGSAVDGRAWPVRATDDQRGDAMPESTAVCGRSGPGRCHKGRRGAAAGRRRRRRSARGTVSPMPSRRRGCRGASDRGSRVASKRATYQRSPAAKQSAPTTGRDGPDAGGELAHRRPR